MELKASKEFLTEALTNGTFSIKDTETALHRSLTNSFSYLYRLQRDLMDYEEHYYNTRNIVENPDYGDLWLDKKDRVCVNFKVPLIAPQNRERYKRSKYFRKEIPLFDTVNTNADNKFELAKEKTLFNKIPIIFMDGSMVKNFSVIIYDTYFTMILPFKKTFLYKKINNKYPWDSTIVNTYPTLGNNVFDDHEFQLQIITNSVMFDINTTRPNLSISADNCTLTFTEDRLKAYTDETIPDDGTFFAVISLARTGNGSLSESELYNASMLQDVDIVVDSNGKKSLVVNLDLEMYQFITSTTKIINIRFVFYRYLKKFQAYSEPDVRVRELSSNPFSELFLIQKEEAEPWELPVPTENLMVLKTSKNNVGSNNIRTKWGLFSHDNVKINYPNIYHVEDNVETGDKLRVYYFYRESYDLKYTYMYRFYMRYLYFKWGQPNNMSIEHIINKLYFGDVDLSQELEVDYTELEQLAVTKQAQLLINDGYLSPTQIGSYSNFVLGLTRTEASTNYENTLDLYLENVDLTVYEALPLVVADFWDCFNEVIECDITEYKYDDIDYLKGKDIVTGKEYQDALSPFEYKIRKLKEFIQDDIKCLHEYILQNNKTSIKYDFIVDETEFDRRKVRKSEVYGNEFEELMYMFTFEKLHSGEDVSCRIFIDGLLFAAFIQEDNGFLEYVYIPVSKMPDGVFVEVELFPSYNQEDTMYFETLDQEYSILFNTVDDIHPTVSDLVIGSADDIYEVYNHSDFELEVVSDDYNYYTNPEVIEDGPDYIKGFPYVKRGKIDWAIDLEGNRYSFIFDGYTTTNPSYKIQPFLAIKSYSDIGYIELQILAINNSDKLVELEPEGDVKFIITTPDDIVLDKTDSMTLLSETYTGASGKTFLIPEVFEVSIDAMLQYVNTLREFKAYIPVSTKEWSVSIWDDSTTKSKYVAYTDTGIVYINSKQIEPISNLLSKWSDSLIAANAPDTLIQSLYNLIDDLKGTGMSTSTAQTRLLDLLGEIHIWLNISNNINTVMMVSNLRVRTFGEVLEEDLDYCRDCTNIRLGKDSFTSYWRLDNIDAPQLDEIGTVNKYYHEYDMNDKLISDLSLTQEDIDNYLVSGHFIHSSKTFVSIYRYDSDGTATGIFSYDIIPSTAKKTTYSFTKPFTGNDVVADNGQVIVGTGYYNGNGEHFLFDGQPDPDNNIDRDTLNTLVAVGKLILSEDANTIQLYPTDNKMKISEDELYVDYTDVSDDGVSIINLTNKGVSSTRLYRLRIKLLNEDLLRKNLTIRLNKDSIFNYETSTYMNYPEVDMNIIRSDRVNSKADLANLGNEYIRVFKNGRLVSKNRYAFLTNLNNPRVQMLEMIKKGDELVVDGTPYLNRLVYFKGELEPNEYGEIYVDLREWINKPFDLRYYEVYLNGRRLGSNNVYPISQWEIRLAGVHSIYSLEIYEKDRDWEYYGCDFNNYFTVSDLFEKAFMEKEIKDKMIEDMFGDLPDNDNEEDREPWERDLTMETLYFEIFYYNRLLPLILATGDALQFNFDDIRDNFTVIFDHYMRAEMTGSGNVLLLSPDEYYGDDSEDVVEDVERWNVYMMGNNDEMAENDFEPDE